MRRERVGRVEAKHRDREAALVEPDVEVVGAEARRELVAVAVGNSRVRAEARARVETAQAPSSRKGEWRVAVRIRPEFPVDVVVRADGNHDALANLKRLLEALSREVEARELGECAVLELEVVVEVDEVRLA